MTNRAARCTKAAEAARRMKARTQLEWYWIGTYCRELAGRARTGRALTRLVRMAVYAEIQADIGTEITQADADRQWAAYCRKEAA